MKIDWKQIGRFISIIVKLFSHLTETFKKLNVGPEILEWITGDGKEIFETEFLVPLTARYTKKDAIFKNWPEICKIKDWNLMVVLSRVEPKSEVGQKLRKAFPECFNPNRIETHGPVPWSLLVVRGKDEAAQRGVEYDPQDLSALGVLEEFDLPYQHVSLAEENYRRYGRENGWHLLPELADNCDFGKVVKWNNHDYVSVSPFGPKYDWIDGETVFVPAECIDLNT
jgi:hypothetical protein